MDIQSLSLMSYGSTAAAGAFFAFSTIVSKSASSRASSASVMFVYMIPCTLLGLVWLLIEQDFRITELYWIPFFVSFLANVAANLLYLHGLKTTQASLAASSIGLTPVFAAFIAWLFLGEVLLFRQWVGIVLSFLGLVVMYLPEKSADIDRKDFYAFFTNPGNRLMVLAAFFWAVASPFDKAAAAAASPQMHCFLIFLAMLPPSFLLIWKQKKLYELRFSYRDLMIISGAGGLRGLGYALQLVALLITPVGVFETLKRISLQFVALVGGRFFYNETITKWKVIGSVIFLCAIPLLIPD